MRWFGPRGDMPPQRPVAPSVPRAHTTKLRRLKAGDTLPGAIHLPLEQLSERLVDLPHDKEIFAYRRGRYRVLEWRVAGIPVPLGAA